MPTTISFLQKSLIIISLVVTIVKMSVFGNRCFVFMRCFGNKSVVCSQWSPARFMSGKKIHVPYKIRQMRADDIPSLYSLLAENQWNMEMSYLSSVFSTDPSGLLVVIGQDGQVIGHNGILNHGSHLASSGMNIVKEEFREFGIGRQLFLRVMEVMKDRNVGGTALSNRISFYEQFGWTIPSFTLQYNQGPVNEKFLQECTVPCDIDIVNIEDVSFEDIVNYDAELNTVPRKRYLDNWAFHETAQSFAAVHKGRIVGYSVLRPADVGWKLYPLYADSKNIARALFAQSALLVPKGEELIFTQPIENEDATDFVKGNNLKTYLSMTRLYNKWRVDVDIRRVFSVSSTEYGIV